jgi:hypothetical protein
MPKKLLILLLAAMLAFPAAIFSDPFSDDNPSAMLQDDGGANGPAPEPGPSGPPQLSGRTKLVLGLSLSVVGTGLTIMGELFRDPFLEARDAYDNLDPMTASVQDIENARKELDNTRLLHYIPMITGLTMTGIGMFITFDGAFSINVYDSKPYTPTPVIPEDESGVVLSRDFTGLVIRY